jgi:hypothetical protein
MVYDAGRHNAGCCGVRCGICYDQENATDPCENCGDDMATEGRNETDLGYYCDACFQREYDRTYSRLKSA